MLGGLSFSYGEESFTIQCNNTSKVMQLFLLLLEAGEEGIPRVQLLEALYGCDDTQDTKNAFRILVFRLRKLLEDTELPRDDYIKVKKGVYRFGGCLNIEIDVKYFSKQAEAAFHISDKEEQINALKKVCDSYTGEFLPFLSNEKWAAASSLHYKEIYFHCLKELCNLLKEKHRYEDILNLCTKVIKIYPDEEWQVVQINCLMEMERYKDAIQIYKNATTLFFEKLGLSPSEKMLSRFRTMSSQIHCAMGSLADIRASLKEEVFSSGAYYCNYPSFIDNYRVISRMIERSGQSVFLMLCTMTDSKGSLIEKESLLAEQSINLSKAICNALRRGDVYTCYSPNQWLILLIGIKQEDCEITYNRIYSKFREKCPGQKIQLRYYVSTIAEVKNSKSRLSFGSSSLWKKK